MPLTRHPARSTFTLEIRRALRRTPEVHSLGKTCASASSSLADQVFGKVSGPPRPRPGRTQPPAPVPPTHSSRVTTPEEDRSEPSARPSPRRILPDLLSSIVTPVEERVRREAQEGAARRKAARVSRTEDETPPRISRSGDEG